MFSSVNCPMIPVALASCSRSQVNPGHGGTHDVDDGDDDVQAVDEFASESMLMLDFCAET